LAARRRAGGGGLHAVALADEQLDAQLVLQLADLLADRAVGDEQLAGGAAVAAMPGGGFKGGQGGKGGRRMAIGC
jgi:hypothetical protein